MGFSNAPFQVINMALLHPVNRGTFKVIFLQIL